MIAAIANLAMLDTIVLSGEGIGLWEIVESDIDAAVRADRDPEAAPVSLLRDESGFSAWARGAAAVAIQSMLPRLRD
jgi:hypothetical protein